MKLASALCLVSILAATTAQAQLFSEGTVGRVYIDGNNGVAIFGTSPVAPSTCSYFGDLYVLDIKTATGVDMLSVLLMAKAQGTAEVWYTPSSKPGATQANGCFYSTIDNPNGTMATVQMIGVP
jgi:hypothetical protein